MITAYAATVEHLTFRSVVARFQVGYYTGIDGDPWLVVDVDTTEEPAAGVQWATARVLVPAVGARTSLVFDVAGQVFDLNLDHPIVLRDVA